MDAKGEQILFEIRSTVKILCLLWVVPYSISKMHCLNLFLNVFECLLLLYFIIITYSLITEIIKLDIFQK